MRITTPPGLGAKSWGFVSTAGVTGGTDYVGGYYEFGSADWTPSGGNQTFGGVNNPYAAHALVVLGGASTDCVIRVTGTSITDAGVRTGGDTQDIDTSGGALNDYFETPKKWLGQVTFSLQSGTSVDVNYGFSKYWDRRNTDFTLLGLEVLGRAKSNDNSFDLDLIHHKATGWTFNAAAEPDPPLLYTMSADHGAESDIDADEYFAWKRANLSTVINGADGEGLLFRVTTGSQTAIQFANFEVDVN